MSTPAIVVDPPEPNDDSTLERHMSEGHVSPDDFEDEALEALLQQPETTTQELRGWYIYDWANSVYFNTVLAALLPAFLLQVTTNLEGDDHRFAFLGSLRLSGSSYYSALVPIAVVMQLILFITLGTIGDFGNLRKRVLVITSTIGAFSTFCFLFTFESTYWIGGLMLIISNLAMGMSIIVYNAFMPALVANLPEVIAARDKPEYATVEEAVSNRVSTRGFVLGYAGGLVLLLLNVVLSLLLPGTSCKQWCADCPQEGLGNATVPGWDRYNYIIQNTTMSGARVFCDGGVRNCLAWPGANPPCYSIDEDLRCNQTDHWPFYKYTPGGVRWTLDPVENATTEAAENWNVTFICTDPMTLRGEDRSEDAMFRSLQSDLENRTAGNDDSLALITDALSDGDNATAALSAAGFPLLLYENSGEEGCTHFRCARVDCSRGHDPVGCDAYALGFRINIALAGVWWFVFSLFTFKWLKPRPAPPLPEGKNYVTESVKRVYTTFKRIRKLKHTFLFLLSYWLFSDGIATVGFAASLIAAQYPLYFESLELGILFIETNLFALLGALFYEWFAKKMVARWRAQQVAAGADADSLDSYWVNRLVIYINLAFISLLPIWGLPDVGLNSPAELFVAAAIYSAQIGSIQAFSRSLLAHFTPVGSESEFFAFFELTDKGTSWLGPIVLTVVKELTGEVRYGVACILAFFIGGAIFLYFVNTRKGGLEAKDFHVAAEVQIDELVAQNPDLKVDDVELDERALQAKVTRKRTLTNSKRKNSLLANEQPEVESLPPFVGQTPAADDDVAAAADADADAEQKKKKDRKKKKRAATSSATERRARAAEASPEAQSERIASPEEETAKQDLPSVPLDG